MKNQNILTLENLEKLVGKTISWKAPSYEGNHPYEGIARISGVNFLTKKPITAEIIEGDDIQFAFIDSEFNPKPTIAYSDSDRYISFEIINEN